MDIKFQRRQSMDLSPKKRLPMQQDLFLRRLNSDILDDDFEFPQCSTPPLAESPSFRRINSELSQPIRQRSLRRLASIDSSEHFNLSTHGRDMNELSTSTHSPDVEQGPQRSQGPRSPILRRLSLDLSDVFHNLGKAPQSDMHFESYGSLSKTKKIRKPAKTKIRIICLTVVMLVLGVLYMEIQFLTSAYIDFDQTLESEVTLQELRIAKYQMDKARELSRLKSLGDIDRKKYTVRINTWRRDNQLIAVIRHYQTCPNIAQIQVVWCDQENKPPAELYHQEVDEKLPKIIVERHAKNSLNERFRMSEDTKAITPTLGILSVDDDVTRPCEAIDAGFYKWTDIPDRILGFDYRVHMITEDHRDDRLDTNPIWAYGYLSSTQMRNQYSITLPRFSFIHRDYFDLYTKFAPQRVISMVDTHTNCEDIAMSFFVSALTHGKVPRLADFWAAMPSMVKLNSPKAISETDDHKKIRDECVDKFAFLYGLKDGYKALTDGKVRNANNVMEDLHSFSSKKLFHDSLFELGDDAGYESYIVLKGFNKGRKELALQLSDWINNQEQSKQKIPFQHVYMKLKSQMKSRGF